MTTFCFTCTWSTREQKQKRGPLRRCPPPPPPPLLRAKASASSSKKTRFFLLVWLSLCVFVSYFGTWRMGGGEDTGMKVQLCMCNNVNDSNCESTNTSHPLLKKEVQRRSVVYPSSIPFDMICLPQVFQGRSGRTVTCPVFLFDTLWHALLTAGVPGQVWQDRDLSCTPLRYSLTLFDMLC